jgi:transcriptional regulator GlxA family with amidase domain
MRTKPYATSVLVFDEVELLDVAGPIAVLSGAGRQWNFQPFKIDLVGNVLGAIATRSGLALEATRTFATSSEVECLIIPGGYGARRAAQEQVVVDWVRRAVASAEFVAAIGNGVWILAQAGLLDGVEVAATLELASELKRAWPEARPNPRDPICASTKILSARASALGLDLACEIVARSFGKKLASSLSAALGIDWSGELDSIDIVPGPVLVGSGDSPAPEHTKSVK